MLVCDFELVNEGRTSAFVGLPPDSASTKGARQDPEAYSTAWNVLAQHRPSQHVLPPGESLWVTARRGLTVAEWANRLAASAELVVLEVAITAYDQFADGVEDLIVVEVAGRPLVQSEENSNTWLPALIHAGLPFIEAISTTPRRTIRRYRNAEGSTGSRSGLLRQRMT
jgi:hypothetical protein